MRITIRPGNARDFEEGSLEELAAHLRAAIPDLQVEPVPVEQRGRAVTFVQVVHLVGDSVDVATAAILIHQAIKWARQRFGRPQPADVPRSINRPVYISVETASGETRVSVQVTVDGHITDHTNEDRAREGRPPLPDAPTFATPRARKLRAQANRTTKKSKKSKVRKNR